MLVILVGGLALTLGLHAPAWLLILFAVLVSGTVALIALAFCYFMLRDPWILRSEDSSLAKHAMDKGLFTPEVAHEILNREKAMTEGSAVQVNDPKEMTTRAHTSLRKSKDSRHSR